MNRFAVVPHFHDYETPESFVSRLAADNGLQSVKQLYSLVGSKVWDSRVGFGSTMARVVDMAGITPERAMRHAVTRIPGHAEANGHCVQPTDLNRTRPRYCPACVASDIEHGHGAVDTRPYQRFWWLYNVIEQCPTHGCEMQVAPKSRHNNNPDDFAAFVRENVEAILAQATDLRGGAVDPFDAYLFARLIRNPTSHWLLDQVPINAAVRFCWALGQLFNIGPAHRRKPGDLEELLDTQRHRRTGFAVLGSSNEEFTRRLEDRLISSGSKVAGTITKYGYLLRVLRYNLSDPDWKPLIDVVRNDLFDTIPVAAGEEVLGVVLERRLIHSPATAAAEYGMHQKTILKVLEARGLVEDSESRNGRTALSFRVDDVHDVLSEVAGSVDIEAASKALGISRLPLKKLLERGVLSEIAVGDTFQGRSRFSRRDLDRIVDFVGNLEIADRNPNGYKPLVSPNRWAHAGIEDILPLVLDGKVRAMRMKEHVGLASVLVHREDTLIALQKPVFDDVPVTKAAEILGTGRHTVSRLIELGFLNSRLRSHPGNGYKTEYLEREQLEKFSDRYVGLSNFATPNNLRASALHGALKKAGIEPLFEPGPGEARVYLRDQLERFLREDDLSFIGKRTRKALAARKLRNPALDGL